MSNFWKRFLAVTLSLVLTLGLAIPAGAVNEPGSSKNVTVEKVEGAKRVLPYAGKTFSEIPEQSLYKDDETVRVSIFLEAAPTIRLYSAKGIGTNASAAAYRDGLEKTQLSVAERISAQALGGKQLDVVHQLTLAANAISANVPYGKIEAIKAVDGVKDVVLEARYEPAVYSTGADDPQMATSGKMIGSYDAWAAGYTGAGSKVAIIDTGLDIEHISFNADAFDYAISSLDNEVDLLDAADVAAVWDQLNISSDAGVSAGDVYRTTKIPFAYNYVDHSLDVTHANDTQGEHGSHVAGIATANRYIKQADGSFAPALNTVYTQGVAPDAQVMVMKVFGRGGGAYDSDYFLAIEDAIVLGADGVNLSLGSAMAGLSTSAGYQEILDGLANCGTTVTMSAGNSGYWAEQTWDGYLYSDGVNFATGGSPGSFTNSFTVASVDNTGSTGSYVTVNNTNVFYSETSGYNNAPMTSIGRAEPYEFVYVDSPGVADNDYSGNDFADLDLTGKIALCNRGSSSFFAKANAAVQAGAVGVIIVNNQPGVINMNLTDYTGPAPCVSILQSDGELFKATASDTTAASGAAIYTGTVVVADSLGVNYGAEDATVGMSSFSSWGLPGNLSLKPEIAAPGGSIYSVNGFNNGGSNANTHDQYEVMSGTSMAAPQVTGMEAVLAQYVRENDLTTATGKSERFLIQSLLSSTAKALGDEYGYYSVLNQGAGLANVNSAINAKSYIEMDPTATASAADGKIKVELGDDPARTGEYSATFTINNLTDEAAVYDVSGAFFTQAVEDGYLLTDTVALPAELSYTVDGAPVAQEDMIGAPEYDLNCDGESNADDAQAILDYIVQGEAKFDELYDTVSYADFDAETADIDADGAVTTYDAYLLLKLVNSAEVAVPANGSVTVKVDISIDMPAEYDDNGAYVEGFLFAEEQVEAAADGGEVAATVHSIPVIGYYGSWLEPDMFDWNTVLDYYYSEKGFPYTFQAYVNSYGTGNIDALFNAAFASGYYYRPYGSADSYSLSGNPFVPDKTYLPERNAINSRDAISQLQFASIRNAAASRLLVTSGENTLADLELGTVYSAYYHVNQAVWMNYAASLNLGGLFSLAALSEGDEVTLSFALAPEYYVENGSVDWDALAAIPDAKYTLDYSMVIDNTAPVIDDAHVAVTEDTITIPVTDNRYVAAVALMNEAYYNTGSGYFDVAGSDPEAELGQEVSYELALSDEIGAHMLVQVYDYAGNFDTYRVNLNAETELTDEQIAQTHAITLNDEAIDILKNEVYGLSYILEPWGIEENVTWTSSDESVATVDENGFVTGVAPGNAVITATSTVTLSDGTTTHSVSDTCDVTVSVIATTLIGALQDAEGTPLAFTWDLENDPTWTAAGEISKNITAATYDWLADEKYIYLQDWSGFIHKIDPQTLAVVSSSESSSAFGAPMEDITFAYGYNNTNNTKTAVAVARGYLLQSDDIMGNTFDNGWNLGSYLRRYTRASSFVAVTWAGVDNTGRDTFLALDNAGYVWSFAADFATGSLSLGYIPTDLSLSFSAMDSEAPMGNSFVSGDDGNYYLAHFNGSTSEIYQLVFFEEGDEVGFFSRRAGDVGADVWPAVLIDAVENEAEDPAPGDDGGRIGRTPLALANVELVATDLQAQSVSASVNALPGGLNAITSERSGNPSEENPELVTVTVTADEAANNGLFTVSYDPEHLTYAGYTTPVEAYSSVNVDEDAGTVTFGFASLEAVEQDGTVIVVKFNRTDNEDTTVTATAEELNDELTPAEPEETVVTNALIDARLAKERLLVRTGRTAEIKLVTDPVDATGYTVTYVCDDESLATVDENGVVTGVAQGDTFVTVTVTPAVGDPIVLTQQLQVRRPTPVVPSEPEEEEFKFIDVPDDAWYHDAAYEAYEKGFMDATGENTFSPLKATTREEIVTILWRLAGKPAAKTSNNFTDSTGNPAIEWAYEIGLAKGRMDANGVITFAPNANVTRQELSAFFYRYAQLHGAAAPTIELTFDDVDQIGDWALESVRWCVQNEIVNGTGDNKMTPNGTATRAELAAMALRMNANFNG